MTGRGGVCFAILAHAHPAALAEQVELLQLLHPGSRVVVFNGGSDRALTAGLEVCPSSRPLRHGHLAPFHAATMEWLAEAPPDYLVTLDSDCLPLRPGLRQVLDGLAADGCGYVGAHLSQVLPDTPWRPGRRFHRAWSGPWQDVFDLPHPYRCFNPVQVFTAEYLRRFMEFPRRQALLDLIDATRLEAMEEIVWPTLAVTLGLSPRALPGGHALRLERHAPRELGALVTDPDVHFVHKVGMSSHDLDRQLVLDHVRGRQPDFGQSAPYETTSSSRRFAATAKDLLSAVQRRR